MTPTEETSTNLGHIITNLDSSTLSVEHRSGHIRDGRSSTGGLHLPPSVLHFGVEFQNIRWIVLTLFS